MPWTFDPWTGEIRFERRLETGGGGLGGGTVTQGVLSFPSGTTLEITQGIASIGNGEITLDPNSELVVLP